MTSSLVTDFTALDDFFLGTLPIPDLDGSVLTVRIGPFAIEAIESHKRRPGNASLTNYQYEYHFLVKDKPSSLGIWRHGNIVPQCNDMIRAYRTKILAEDTNAFPPKSKRHIVA